MKISEHLHKFHLHDSNVASIDYHPEKKYLAFELKLCDRKGEGASDEVFGKSGTLNFYGVEAFKTEPDLGEISWDKNYGFEILYFDYQASLNSSEAEGVSAMFEFREIPRKIQQSVLIITFSATHFEWVEIN
jgi:hypothetical protein